MLSFNLGKAKLKVTEKEQYITRVTHVRTLATLPHLLIDIMKGNNLVVQ